ncbi:bifunctional lysylphosphatidylglycerol flippase/synthetase MprF [Granulosicoccus antarcticus]|uniref:Phosphatidylglycerol lysyltransferase n=1 Tax=Granulosicoccus antarcticus IMCC3135 TaxID=1192854 RepID=A0A2Z2NTV4_9GAMM|nr:bifunctional lysylphosphatidylglycerol flippase/synthetase MprF [Granulosicoccus antarcticus]ASJ74703.1 Phosphatidylglycerol lysyltransferase [Granulosicoccus antarcticus IMCC3135]
MNANGPIDSLPETSAKTRLDLHAHAPVIAALLLFCAGMFAIYRLLHGIDVHEIIASFGNIPETTFVLALLTTLGSYIALIGYDRSALQYIGHSAPLPLLVAGSFTANALGNTIGLSALSGGAVRWRVYRGLGLDTTEVAIVSAFCATSLGLGLLMIGLVGLSIEPSVATSWLPMDETSVRMIALAIILSMLLTALYLSMTGDGIRIGQRMLSLPKPRVLGEQILYSVVDMLLASATLYLLLPDSVLIDFAPFVAIFAVASLIAVISHVPGGIGVFESVVIAGVGIQPDNSAALVAALFAYRAIYYLIPLLLALTILALLEAIPRKGFIARHLPNRAALGKLAEESGPLLVLALSSIVFLVGSVLLLNGLVPIPQELLNDILPLIPTTVLEVSNVIIGIVGAGLVLLSNGLRQRIRAAFWLCFALLIAAIISLLVQSIDYDIAAVVMVVTALLWAARREFYRASRLSSRLFSREWIALVGGLLLALILTFFIAHRETPYSNALWWQMAQDENTPRALRLFGSAIAAALIAGLFFALRPAIRQESRPELPKDKLLHTIIQSQYDPDAGFVYMGDKEVLMNAAGDAFIMYARQGRTLVALGDPIGPRTSAAELIDDFVSLADRENRRPAFYRISPKLLTYYIDVGFSLSKLGEAAEVKLANFSLEGPPRSKLRQRYKRAERDGLTLEWIETPHVPGFIESLRPISDNWLAHKNTREKEFSLGRFDPAYLARFPIVVVRQGEEIVAFANVLTAGSKEASIDLMRFTEHAPSGTMEFLFIGLMLELKTREYDGFSLGTAPLIGLDRARHKRLWDHLGGAVSTFGGRFYNFEGLRDYKNKFLPEWEPRYMATWGGMDPLLVAADVNALVSGGFAGSIRMTRKP